jgi:serine/threonine protein kinase
MMKVAENQCSYVQPLFDQDLFGLFSNNLQRGQLQLKPQMKSQVICGLFHILRELAAQNVVHRDIKPENLLLQMEPFEIKLTDFDFATEPQGSDKLCGTHTYMAPEYAVLTDKKVDSETRKALVKERTTSALDVWAVGLILIFIRNNRLLNPHQLEKDEISQIAQAIHEIAQAIHKSDDPQLLRQSDDPQPLSQSDIIRHARLQIQERLVRLGESQALLLKYSENPPKTDDYAYLLSGNLCQVVFVHYEGEALQIKLNPANPKSEFVVF